MNLNDYIQRSTLNSKFQVLNQLLNTIGNGIANDEELARHLADRQTIKPRKDPLPEILDSDVPHPCFEREYSMAYRCPSFLELGDDWIEGAIWFYETCLRFFSSMHANRYYYAFPKADTNVQERIKEFERKIAGLSYEQVSEQWEHPFHGDVRLFLTELWEKEQQRIREFIDATLIKLTIARYCNRPVEYGNQEGQYFTQWRIELLEELLVATIAAHGDNPVELEDPQIWYDDQHDYHRLSFRSGDNTFDVRLYKVFSVSINGEDGWTGCPRSNIFKFARYLREKVRTNVVAQ